MITAPFTANTGARLSRGSFTITYTATASTPIGTFPLAVIGGRVSWSDRRAPMVSATLDVAWPTAAQRDALDPRRAARVTLAVTYDVPEGSPDTQQVFDLGIRRRTVRRADGTVTLELASDEAMVIGSSPNGSGVPPAFGSTAPQFTTYADGQAQIWALIRDALCFPTRLPDTRVAISGTRRSVTMPNSWDDMWATITEAADALDVDVFDPGDRVFRIQDPPTVTADVALELVAGAGSVLLDSEDETTLDDWANFVVVRHEWTNPANGYVDVVFGTARVTGGPFRADTVGYTTVVERRDSQATTTTAYAEAAAILRRALSRAGGLRVQTVPAWWVRPGHTISYTAPDGVAEKHLVSEVEHDLGALTMDVVTRRPPDAATTIGT